MGCYGQDWASYQSPAPDVTGLSFVFVKATEGLTYANPRWAQQVAYARLHKLTVGHYHYPHMGNSATAEADFFLRTARPQPGDYVALDWEGYDVANRSVPFAAQVAYKKAFLAHVTEALPHKQRWEEHRSELQSHVNLVCRLLLEKKKKQHHSINSQ